MRKGERNSKEIKESIGVRLKENLIEKTYVKDKNGAAHKTTKIDIWTNNIIRELYIN